MAEEKKESGEQDKRQGSGQISRRDFLKDAGLVVGTPAIGSMAAVEQAQGRTSGRGETAEGAAPASGTKCPDSPHVVELTVNGGKYRCSVEPHWSLRQLLRDQIGLTSPKDWCGGLGACGSCTVIVNGRPVLSCLTLACECDGARVETAEGIAKAKHPIIQAYINNNAFQCGYCTPGFVCTAKALLDRNSDPSEADVRDALGGNLCRCATYQRHPPAVLEAARNLKQET